MIQRASAFSALTGLLVMLSAFQCIAQSAAPVLPHRFQIDAWADNWFAAYLNGELLLEDSVSIRTERSFNAESKHFTATYPLQLAFIIKDFKQNDTGLEYIGSHRQQMGDGGFIMQITELDSVSVVGVSSSAMRCKVIHKAPLADACAGERQPVAGRGNCAYQSEPEPVGWQKAGFDDSSWRPAREYSVSQVRPKDGYERIRWNRAARLIWSDDLEKDNTLLCRLTVFDGSARTESNRKTQAGSTTPQVTHSHGHEHPAHEHFSHFHGVETSESKSYLLISSNGLPEHNMMKGISSWQQQVPLPQDYTGDNSWRIPLKPQLAEQPMSLKNHFHRGAVAIAVNGVPLFNALNNRGKYAAHAGELDQWGGHSGRADDYHYHLAPEHLEAVVGKGKPIAYALDGFPLYSRTNKPLDEYLGRFNEVGGYQYHAVDYPPYFIAAMRGVVKTDSPANAPEDQIEPQPRSQPVRGGNYGPLRGAEITDFKKTGDKAYSLEYRVNNESRQVNYSWTEAGAYRFVFVDGVGRETVETYQRNMRQAGGQAPARGEQSRPGRGNPAPNGRGFSDNDRVGFQGPGSAKPDSRRRRPPRPERGEPRQQRRYCGDGLCDNTENRMRCPVDCSQ
ncbi:MAG: YHYH protein [Gammaproteobacteria bacterium]